MPHEELRDWLKVFTSYVIGIIILSVYFEKNFFLTFLMNALSDEGWPDDRHPAGVLLIHLLFIVVFPMFVGGVIVYVAELLINYLRLRVEAWIDQRFISVKSMSELESRITELERTKEVLESRISEFESRISEFESRITELERTKSEFENLRRVLIKDRD